MSNKSQPNKMAFFPNDGYSDKYPHYNTWCKQDLLIACENGEYQTVETLLKYGFDVHQRDSIGRTPSPMGLHIWLDEHCDFVV